MCIQIVTFIYKYTNILHCRGEMRMLTTIRLDKEIQKQLKLRSAETGKSQLELANQYILEGLRNNKPSKTGFS